MISSYVAFGLQIDCDVALPAMPQRRGACGEQALRVELVDREVLESAWSGSQSGSGWRGRLGDGTELTIERGRGGDIRMVNSERAAYRLDAGARQLQCAAADPDGLAWKRILLSRILPNVSLAIGNEALHASAVEAGGVVVFCGPSGAGKSTMAAEMLRRGHRHFTDDVLILAPGSSSPLAHPGSPHTNFDLDDRGSLPDAVGEPLELHAGEAWAGVDGAADAPQRVDAVVLLERHAGVELTAERLPASPLHLAPYMLGLPDEDGDGRRLFSLYADLAEEATLVALRGSERESPAELADALESVLAPLPEASSERAPIEMGRP